MIGKLLLFIAIIALNLYVASKKEGPMKRALQIAAVLWAAIGFYFVYTTY